MLANLPLSNEVTVIYGIAFRISKLKSSDIKKVRPWSQVAHGSRRSGTDTALRNFHPIHDLSEEETRK